MIILAYFVILIAFVVIFTTEVICPASGASCDKRWQIYAGVVNIISVASVLLAGVFFEDVFQELSLFTLPSSLSSPVVGLISFLTASFIAYFWHLAMHKSDFLWRVFHQLHHSPSRIESLTSFYLHPFDALAGVFINALCAYFLFGADAEVAAWAMLYAGLNNLIIHADIASPYWLGYFIQRPEMHRLHHKRDYHAKNYGLPIWDIVFGSFENSNEKVEDCGFTAPREKMVFDMLMMRIIDR